MGACRSCVLDPLVLWRNRGALIDRACTWRHPAPPRPAGRGVFPRRGGMVMGGRWPSKRTGHAGEAQVPMAASQFSKKPVASRCSSARSSARHRAGNLQPLAGGQSIGRRLARMRWSPAIPAARRYGAVRLAMSMKRVVRMLRRAHLGRSAASADWCTASWPPGRPPCDRPAPGPVHARVAGPSAAARSAGRRNARPG